MASLIDRDILLQTLRGYAEVNEITDAERRASLANLTSAESWAAFAALYDAWRHTGQKAGGDWAALVEQRLAETMALRKSFERLARRKGLI